MTNPALGYNRRNTGRLLATYTDLLEYLGPNPYPVGGVCIRWYLAQANRDLPNRPFNGLDIVSTSLNPNVTEKFLIVHYHPEDSYWSLIHEDTGTKVNIFEPRHESTLYERQLVPGFTVLMQSAGDQLVSVLEDIQKPLRGQRVDPKQFEDAWRLYRIVPPEEREKAWRGRNPQGPNFEAAFSSALEGGALHRELLRSGLYTNVRHLIRQLLPCSECAHTIKYPLASKRNVAKTFRR